MPGLPRPISGLPKVGTIDPNDLLVLQRGTEPMSLTGSVIKQFVKDSDLEVDSTLTKQGFAADAYYTGKAVGDLTKRLKSGKIADADLHLGFYLDADGDLCQKEV